jgi:hypothetical protein
MPCIALKTSWLYEGSAQSTPKNAFALSKLCIRPRYHVQESRLPLLFENLTWLLYQLAVGNFKVVRMFLSLEAALQFPSHVLFDGVFAVNELAVNV